MRKAPDIYKRLIAYGLRDLAESVAASHGVALNRILHPVRERDVTAARHELWHAIYKREGWTYALIGELFGVDESSVCWAVDAHLNRQGRVA